MSSKKEITLNDIAELIKLSAEQTEKRLEESLGKKIDSSIEKLATMTQKQFLELGEKITTVERKIDNIEFELNKKVDKIDHNTLVYQVEKLEKKIA